MATCPYGAVTVYLANTLAPENEIGFKHSIFARHEAVGDVSVYSDESRMEVSVYNALGLDIALDIPATQVMISAYHAIGQKLDAIFMHEFECGTIARDYVRASGIGEHRVTQENTFRRFR